jgi:exosortase
MMKLREILMYGQEASCPFLFFRLEKVGIDLPMKPLAQTDALPLAQPNLRKAQFPVWAGPVVYALLLGGLLATTFTSLVTLWNRDPNYNHGFLILPIAVLLGYRAYKKSVDRIGPSDRALGWIALVLGGLSHLVAILLVVPLLDFLTILLLVRGGLLFAGGRRWAAAFVFPLVFLVFMFPLPPMWLSTLALWLQDIAARVSETILSLFVVCTRNGHNIRIAGVDGSLVVAEECSGTRQIVAFVALAALYGYWTTQNRLYRVLLLLLAIPVAVVANVLRVVLMNMGAYWFGTKWMGTWLHDMPALFSLPVGLALFFLMERTLTRIFARTPTPSPPPENTQPEAVALPSDFPSRWIVPIGVVLILIALSFSLNWHLSEAGSRSYPQLKGTFDSVPLKFPSAETPTLSWHGVDFTELREETRSKLLFQVDDLLYRGYQTADQGTAAHVYMVYSRTGDDRKHHPEVCIRDVSGAPEDPKYHTRIRLAQENREAQRFVFVTGGASATVVYYWHYTLAPDRVPNSPFRALHQVFGTAPPSITVQVSATLDSRTTAVIERTLLPQLDAFMMEQVLPPDTKVGCTRLPVVLIRR